MKKVYLLIITLLFLSIPAFATNWYQLQDKIYIDLDSIQPYNAQFGLSNNQTNTYIFWSKELNTNSNTFKDIENIYHKKFWFVMNREVINCNNQTMGLTSYADYDLNGNVLGSHEYDNYQIKWYSIVPDTISNLFYNIVCTSK